MPPVENDTGKTELKTRIQTLIDSNQVMVFSKSYCPFCIKVKDLFKELQVDCNVVELDLIEDGTNYQEMLLQMTGQKTVPNVFINKTHIGGCDKTMQAHKDGSLQQLLSGEKENYDYDLIVIGGGSGGLACSKLRGLGRNEIGLWKETFYTSERFVLATGERPRYLGIPGDKEYCITSDDLFYLPHCPGKTLVIGASYVALECGGFLAGLGLDVTVMVRSILLRGFDQDMANRAGEYMEGHGVKFLRQYVPTKIEELEAGTPGRLKVTAKSTETDEIFEGEYNTVLIAVGRDACTDKIGLDKAGVKVNAKNGKIPVNDEEQTNVPHIHAIGDILEGKWELTPVAIQAGKLLARRLYAGSKLKCDYVNVPTTVFTPLEYGSCGLSEERALELYGEENLEIYHSQFWPLEFTVPGRDNNKSYAKIICNKLDNERVIGFHYLGPNAGEVTQGFGAAIKCGVTKELLDVTIGIHPTCAEIFTTMEVTKSSGGDITAAGC
uniref:thioredoxin-disulfide reductase (NADPH) n=1 Tax=Neogobius melanostomus TaxID=47308 RepID=A0A8C6UKD4_9GOBI